MYAAATMNAAAVAAAARHPVSFLNPFILSQQNFIGLYQLFVCRDVLV